MSESVDRQRIMCKIERVFTSFQQMLKLGIRPALFLPEYNVEDAEILELNGRNAYRFLFVTQVLLNIYVSVKTNTYRTKRDLYYESKHIFETQDALDDTVNSVTRLLQETRFSLHILATSKGLVIGDLKFKVSTSEDEDNCGGTEIDCQNRPVQIPMLPMEVTDIQSNASFILIAEKDATFQCFVDENSCAKLGPCILLTAKGYPDYATRVFLYRLHSELQLPVYALMDADPYGIDIYMIYKYGAVTPRLYDVFDIALPSLVWLGVYPSEATKLPVEPTSKLPLSDRERDKATQLSRRANTLEECFVTQQLNHLIEEGYKIEIEAIAALGHGYLTERYLKRKLAAIVAEN